MPNSLLHDAALASRLDELIADYLQAAADGSAPSRGQLLAEHPDLADELQSFFAAHDLMRHLAVPPSTRSPSGDTPQSLYADISTLLFPIEHPRADAVPSVAPAVANSSVQFGDYELLEEIGRGGMGVIFRARQRSLNRIVALKMILGNRLADQEELQRFSSEAETAAQLQHQGIVQIFEVGRHQGQHYFSMEYVDGLNLGARMSGEELLAPTAAAEIVRRVAEAVGYAHERGVIHRDLKPANILLARSSTRTGVLLSAAGATASYEPKVADFGLAKRTETDSGITGTGQILGTPSYMPPEQAAGRTAHIGPLADVYSLGAVLYALLTGRPPFRAASAMETLQQVIEQEPVRPRQLNPAIPKDLETICLKCLQKSPVRRYASAEELEADLSRFQNGEPIAARPIGFWVRGWMWTRRRPALAALIVVGFVAVMTFVGLVASGRYRTQLENLSYRQGVTLARLAWRDNDISSAQQLLEGCPQHLRGWEWSYVERLCDTGLERTLPSTNSCVYSVAYSHDGRYLACGDERGPIHIWEAATGAQVMTLTGHRGFVKGVAFSPLGGHLASASWDGSIKLWDLDQQRDVQSLNAHEGSVCSVAFSSDATRLVSAGQDGTVRVWNPSSGVLLHVLLTGDHEARDATFSRNGEQQRPYPAPPARAGARDATFSRNGEQLAAACANGNVHLWRLDNLSDPVVLKGHAGGVNSVAFRPDGLRLASAATIRQSESGACWIGGKS